MKKALIITLIFLSVVGISLGGVYFWVNSKIHESGPLVEEKSIIIKKGQGVRAIGRALESAGIVSDERLFALQARFTDMHRKLKAGEYLFRPGMSIPDVLKHLSSNDTVIRSITLPEGLTSREIVDLLYADENLQGDVDLLPIEGSLLPETYHYSLGDTRSDIINRMQQSLMDTKTVLWSAELANQMPYESWDEVLILASIVEKETAVARERPQVASVFVNRLRLGMRLQSDPTVIYALTNGLKPLGRTLTRKDWKYDHPFNTYVIKGLPPKPIGNPGKEAITAVLNPDETKYLYFVADGTGGHAFAKNLKEHNRNVAKWRKIKNQ